MNNCNRRPQGRLLMMAGLLATLCGTALSPLATAADAPPVTASEIAPGLYLFSGGGGANSSALIGDEGVLVVDSKLDATSASAELAAIQELEASPLRFLINTHVHPDHTGGNEIYGEAGAVIIGHEDVRAILAAGQRGGPPAPAAALPVLTFASGSGVTLHLNDETIRVLHVPPAHTADNSIVHFVNANVYQLGDVYSGNRYPMLAGGTLQGFIAAVDMVLAETNDSARFIPGNGPVTGRAELESYRAMLVSTGEQVSQAISAGKTLEQVTAANPTAAYDATYGAPERFLSGLYNDLQE